MFSVCFITKNEERWIGDCIAHLRPLVNEFIVLDTGSTDRTIEIAKSHGARVEHFQWVDDFSAARNAVLKLATQKWILGVDPDERIDPKEFQYLREIVDSEAVAFEIYSRTYTENIADQTAANFFHCRGEYPEYEKKYVGYALTRGIRVFKRLPEISYHGRVHETIVHTLPPNADVRILEKPVLHHYGYTSEVTRDKNKDEYYLKLLVSEPESSPVYWFSQFTLGNYLVSQGDIAGAVKAYEKAYPHRPHRAEVLSNFGHALTEAGDLKRAEALLKECVVRYPDFELGRLNYAAVLMSLARYEEVIEIVDGSLQKNPNSHLMLRVLGQAQSHLKDFDGAEMTFRRALKLAPDFVDLQIDLALLLKFAGENARAHEEMKAVLQRYPNYNRAQSVLKIIEIG